MGNLRIFHNGKIATNSKPYFAEAIAVEDGKISEVGRNSEVLRLKRPDTETVDLRGQTVIPGLNDSHLHIIRGGFPQLCPWSLGTACFETREKLAGKIDNGKRPGGREEFWFRT
jgi:predicted amidohydrolase YtcJ